MRYFYASTPSESYLPSVAYSECVIFHYSYEYGGGIWICSLPFLIPFSHNCIPTYSGSGSGSSSIYIYYSLYNTYAHTAHMTIVCSALCTDTNRRTRNNETFHTKVLSSFPPFPSPFFSDCIHHQHIFPAFRMKQLAHKLMRLLCTKTAN